MTICSSVLGAFQLPIQTEMRKAISTIHLVAIVLVFVVEMTKKCAAIFSISFGHFSLHNFWHIFDKNANSLFW